MVHQVAQGLIHCRGRFAEQAVALIVLVIGKDVIFAAVHSVLAQISAGSPAFLQNSRSSSPGVRKALLRMPSNMPGRSLPGRCTCWYADWVNGPRTGSTSASLHCGSGRPGRCGCGKRGQISSDRGHCVGRCLETGFEPVEGVIGYGDERADHIIVFHETHQGAPADLLRKSRSKSAGEKRLIATAVFQAGSRIDMDMLAASGDALDRFCQK